jgi:adenylate cyclase
MKSYDSSLLFLREAKTVFERLGDQNSIGYCLGNMGMVYASMGKDKLAEKNLNEAIRILERAEDFSPICEYHISMADVYLGKGDALTALSYATRSLRLAEQYGLREQRRDASQKLSEIYERTGNTSEALRHYKNYVAYKDSINNLDVLQGMNDMQRRYEVSQEQRRREKAEADKKAQQKLVIALVVILGLSIGLLAALYLFYKAIAREKTKSEELLLNILPAETAMELKQNGRVEAVKFDQVTVLFTDFVEFSKQAEHVEPELLVKSIDAYFKRFDEITTRYGLEKIKTVGDSYMCAGGLPTANPAHARNVMLAAREMMDLVTGRLHAEDGLCHFNIRMGVHTGPVVAGIVGIKKWQYDIWGDTVNVASRMESMSKPGRINLSETTWQKIKDEFPCEYRGEIEVKNRGPLKMYFLL